MSIEGLTTIIRNWASARGGVPFTASHAFESIKDADDAKEVADRVRQLWAKGDLARRKNGDGKFEYVWAACAPAGFEMGKDTGIGKAAPAAPAEPSASMEIPPFLRKGQPSMPAAAPGPEILDFSNKEQSQPFSAEAIAEALIRKLKPVLQAQFANAALESTDVLTEPCSRITLRIKELEVTVEGLL